MVRIAHRHHSQKRNPPPRKFFPLPEIPSPPPRPNARKWSAGPEPTHSMPQKKPKKQLRSPKTIDLPPAAAVDRCLQPATACCPCAPALHPLRQRTPPPRAPAEASGVQTAAAGRGGEGRWPPHWPKPLEMSGCSALLRHWAAADAHPPPPPLASSVFHTLGRHVKGNQQRLEAGRRQLSNGRRLGRQLRNNGRRLGVDIFLTKKKEKNKPGH